MRLQAVSCAYVKLIYYSNYRHKKTQFFRLGLVAATRQRGSFAMRYSNYVLSALQIIKISASTGVIVGSPDRSRLLFSISMAQLMSACRQFRGLIGDTPLPPWVLLSA
tara:strand:- start:2787 stop:3110 length:324 start_codon:yes stop_codon:yes gene_type:complete